MSLLDFKLWNKYKKDLINYIYKNNDVSQGYFYWRSRLTDILMDIFEIHNLPSTLPKKEILYRLFTTGYCGILKIDGVGIIACDSNPFNFDIYGNFKNVNFYNPSAEVLKAMGKTYTINKDCIVIYAGDTEKKVNQPYMTKNVICQTINRYARLLADLETTLNINVITDRMPYFVIAQNQQTKSSFLDIFKSLKNGQFFVGVDGFDIKDSKTLKNKDIVSGFNLELIECRRMILEQFLQEFGIFIMNSKKERLIVQEVETENKNYKIFVNSLLESIEQGIKDLNSLYGLDVSVELNNEIFGGVIYDDTGVLPSREENID